MLCFRAVGQAVTMLGAGGTVALAPDRAWIVLGLWHDAQGTRAERCSSWAVGGRGRGVARKLRKEQDLSVVLCQERAFQAKESA